MDRSDQLRKICDWDRVVGDLSRYDHWRDHHGLGLVLVYRDTGKEPTFFDMADLSRLSEKESFK